MRNLVGLGTVEVADWLTYGLVNSYNLAISAAIILVTYTIAMRTDYTRMVASFAPQLRSLNMQSPPQVVATESEVA